MLSSGNGGEGGICEGNLLMTPLATATNGQARHESDMLNN